MFNNSVGNYGLKKPTLPLVILRRPSSNPIRAATPRLQEPRNYGGWVRQADSPLVRLQCMDFVIHFRVLQWGCLGGIHLPCLSSLVCLGALGLRGFWRNLHPHKGSR